MENGMDNWCECPQQSWVVSNNLSPFFPLLLNHVRIPCLRGSVTFIGHQDGEVVWSNCRCNFWAKLKCQELKGSFSLDWSSVHSTSRICLDLFQIMDMACMEEELDFTTFFFWKSLWRRDWVSGNSYFFWLMVHRETIIAEFFWHWTTTVSLSDFWDVDTKGLDELSEISCQQKMESSYGFLYFSSLNSITHW